MIYVLQAVLTDHGFSSEGCLDREDLVVRAKEALENSQPPPPRIPGAPVCLSFMRTGECKRFNESGECKFDHPPASPKAREYQSPSASPKGNQMSPRARSSNQSASQLYKAARALKEENSSE